MPVPNPRPSPPRICRRKGYSILERRTPAAAPSPENSNVETVPVLHCPPLPARGKYLQFESFDESYFDRLRSGDFRTQEHFSNYFGVLIKIKLASRLKGPEAIEDVRQETFARFFTALRAGKVLQPERLGAFVNSICNNVLMEHYRSAARNPALENDGEKDFPAPDFDFPGMLDAQKTGKRVRQILEKLGERDRRLLREVFLEERDKDEVCRDFGVDREYLRVLLHRAKQAFKAVYLKHTRQNPPDFARA